MNAAPTGTGADLVERYDPFSREVMADPLPFYRALRDHDPVHYLPDYDTFAISRFDDVWNVLGDVSGTFVSSESSLPLPSTLREHNDGPVPDPPTDPMGSANMFGSPVYEQFRHAQGRPLRPGAVKRLEGFLRERARARLAELLPRKEFDLAQDYGGHVAAGAVCHLMGLPYGVAREILEIVNSSTGTHRNAEGGLDKKMLFGRSMEVLVPAVARHRAGDRTAADDAAEFRSAMIDGLLDMEFEGRRLNDEEVAVNLVCVFVGGTETVPKVTAHGLWELAKDPSQLVAVRADLGERVPLARNEFIRYCAPAQWFLRTVRESAEISGTPVRPGQRVMCLMGSAARDDREFTDPDRFRWDRRDGRELSFGRGQHYCIGVHLAKLEVAVVAEEFLAAVRDYEIDDARAVRHPSSFQWGWNVVPVRATAGTQNGRPVNG